MRSYHYGMGRHMYYLDSSQISGWAKWSWVGKITNLFAIYLVRISICLFLLRLIPPKGKFYLSTTWVTIVALSFSDILITISYLVECRPLRKVWHPDTPGICLSPALGMATTWLFQGTVALPVIRYLELTPEQQFPFWPTSLWLPFQSVFSGNFKSG